MMLREPGKVSQVVYSGNSRILITSGVSRFCSVNELECCRGLIAIEGLNFGAQRCKILSSIDNFLLNSSINIMKIVNENDRFRHT